MLDRITRHVTGCASRRKPNDPQRARAPKLFGRNAQRCARGRHIVDDDHKAPSEQLGWPRRNYVWTADSLRPRPTGLACLAPTIQQPPAPDASVRSQQAGKFVPMVIAAPTQCRIGRGHPGDDIGRKRDERCHSPGQPLSSAPLPSVLERRDDVQQVGVEHERRSATVKPGAVKRAEPNKARRACRTHWPAHGGAQHAASIEQHDVTVGPACDRKHRGLVQQPLRMRRRPKGPPDRAAPKLSSGSGRACMGRRPARRCSRPVLG